MVYFIDNGESPWLARVWPRQVPPAGFFFSVSGVCRLPEIIPKHSAAYFRNKAMEMLERAAEAQSREITTEYLALANHWLRLSLFLKAQKFE